MDRLYNVITYDEHIRYSSNTISMDSRVMTLIFNILKKINTNQMGISRNIFRDFRVFYSNYNTRNVCDTLTDELSKCQNVKSLSFDLHRWSNDIDGDIIIYQIPDDYFIMICYEHTEEIYSDGYVYYICDTIDGVNQLMLKIVSFGN